MISPSMRFRFAALITALSLSLPIAASAESITVLNPSFEILPSGTLLTGAPGPYSQGSAIPGWISSDPTNVNDGVFQPDTISQIAFNTVDDGPTSAWSRGATLSQAVGAVVSVGMTYTLMVDIGWRNDRAFDGSADLLINGITYQAIGKTPPQGGWSTFIATYVGLQQDAGLPITIQLNASGPQGNFDNVRLTNSATPEPAVGVLVGSCLIGLACLRRKRSRRSQ